MELKIVDFNNYKDAIKIQREIFPQEDGTINILASLNRSLFIKITGIFYPDDRVKYYIAISENEPIGITGLYSINNKEVWLAWFGILPNYRRRGYGEELLKETINLAKKLGYKGLRLYTDKVGNSEAIKLYEKVGFIGEKYLAEKLSYDCWIYSKNLDSKEIELWDNKNLNLLYQSELDQMDKKKVKEILELYKKHINNKKM